MIWRAFEANHIRFQEINGGIHAGFPLLPVRQSASTVDESPRECTTRYELQISAIKQTKTGTTMTERDYRLGRET